MLAFKILQLIIEIARICIGACNAIESYKCLKKGAKLEAIYYLIWVLILFN
jgi:hypothetical protein|nr:MAG TPA: hypothetical protein [Caudoviricetes sp.]